MSTATDTDSDLRIGSYIHNTTSGAGPNMGVAFVIDKLVAEGLADLTERAEAVTEIVHAPGGLNYLHHGVVTELSVTHSVTPAGPGSLQVVVTLTARIGLSKSGTYVGAPDDGYQG